MQRGSEIDARGGDGIGLSGMGGSLSNENVGGAAERAGEGAAGGGLLTDEEYALQLQAHEERAHMLALAGYGTVLRSA